MATRKQRELKQSQRLQHMDFTKARGKLKEDEHAGAPPKRKRLRLRGLRK